MSEKPNRSPVDQFKRDNYGLIETQEYIHEEDGSINWRAMIKDEHLYPNKDYFLRFDKEVPESIEGLKDNQLLIKLSGIKELARLRGIKSSKFITEKLDDDYVVVKSCIKFIGNYETSMEDVYFEEVANATYNNTDGFSAKFLESIAANRAFVRCVRNFLNIHIVGADEIDKSDGEPINKEEVAGIKDTTPNALLEKKAKAIGFVDFESFKKGKMRELWKEDKYKNENTSHWESYQDIEPKEARILLEIIS